MKVSNVSMQAMVISLVTATAAPKAWSFPAGTADRIERGSSESLGISAGVIAGIGLIVGIVFIIIEATKDSPENRIGTEDLFDEAFLGGGESIEQLAAASGIPAETLVNSLVELAESNAWRSGTDEQRMNLLASRIRVLRPAANP